MRLLVVAMAESIHTARWLRQLEGLGWDVRVFSALWGPPHPDLRQATVYTLSTVRGRFLDPSVRIRGVLPVPRRASYKLPELLPGLFDARRRLASVIRRFRPDVIHSMEIQHCGDLVAETLGPGGPPWLMTNWGSDLMLYHRLPEHRVRLERALARADYYSCECRRDVDLARSLGFRGHVLPVIPATGGIRFEEADPYRSQEPPSRRGLVVLKGYQHFAGRALVGLEALRRCADVLRKGYLVVVFGASPDVALAARLMAEETGLAVKLAGSLSHPEVLALHGKARVSIGLSIGDGLSISFLEAATMGSFPVQSRTSCGGELLDGALFVPPEDPEEVARAIRRALTDDALVDEAAVRNRQVLESRLSWDRIRPAVLENYRRVARREPPVEVPP